jgi:hypothetical protein
MNRHGAGRSSVPADELMSIQADVTIVDRTIAFERNPSRASDPKSADMLRPADGGRSARRDAK